MSQPILVVHGIANHDQDAFRNTVQALETKLRAKTGGEWALLPVYWADLGGQLPEGVFDILPGHKAPEVNGEEMRHYLTVGIDDLTATRTQKVRAGNEKIAIVVAAAIQPNPQAAISGFVVRSTGSQEELQEGVELGISAQWTKTTLLQWVDDRAVLEALGAAIGEATAPLTHEDRFGQPVRGMFGDFKDVVQSVTQGVVRQFDIALGAVTGTIVGRVNYEMRHKLGPGFIKSLGDIFAYEGNRTEVQDRLWQTLSAHGFENYGREGNPVNVIAHSLGGVVAFDAANRAENPLHIKTFLTFGSQASLFNVAVPRGFLNRYSQGQPIQVGKTIGNWLNLYEPLDFLAFRATPVFQLDPPAVDREVPHRDSYGLYTHSIYWQTEHLVDAIVDSMG